MAYHHGDLRNTLIATAIQLLEQKGAELTLRHLARKVGVTPTAVYHHFKDKDALLAAVAEEGFTLLAGAMQAAGAREKSARDKLEAIGRAYVKFAVAHRGHFRVMFSTSLAAAWKKAPLSEISRASFMVLLEAVADVSGRAKAKDGAILGWSAMHGLAGLWLEGPLPEVDDRSIDQLAKAIARLATDAVRRS